MKVSYRGFTAEEWADRFDEQRQTLCTVQEALQEASEEKRQLVLQNDEMRKALTCQCPICFYGERCEVAMTTVKKYIDKQKCDKCGGDVGAKGWMLCDTCAKAEGIIEQRNHECRLCGQTYGPGEQRTCH